MEEEIITPGPYFKFPDKETWLNEARKNNFTFFDEDGNEHVDCYTSTYSIDDMGYLYEEKDSDGNYYANPVLIDGYHINFNYNDKTTPLPEGWEQYLVYPKTPGIVTGIHQYDWIVDQQFE